ncbi:phage major capsid protein, partial [Rahnella aceris]
LIAKGMDMDGLTEARKAMRLQEDADGNPLNVTPAYIIVPAALEGAAMRTVQSTSSPFQIGTQTVGSDTNPVFNQNAGVANTVQNMGQVIVEPRLDKKNAQQWYVASAKGSDT